MENLLFLGVPNLGTLQPNYDVLKYWDTWKLSFFIWDKLKSSGVKCPNT